jgi:hypothetical protein
MMIDWRDDPRGRALAILAGVTVLFVVCAIVALAQLAAEGAPKFDARLLFPNLQKQLDQLAEIDVTDANGTLHVKNTDKGWVVVERDNFPADFDQLRQTAVGMSELQLVEPKTANPDFLDALDLSDPAKKGRAVKLALLDKSGKVLAEALFGKTVQTTDTLGRSGVFVRRPNENQAYLARGYVMASSVVGDWLAKNVLNVGRERIQQVSVEPATGPAYTVSRDAKDQPDFKLADIPKGREIAYDSAPDGVAAAITGFTYEDIRKAAQFDFSKATQVTTKTFDGLTVRVRVITQDSGEEKEYWATVAAQADSAEAEAEASLINARAGDWAFKLPEYKGQIFSTSRDSLLKPPGQKDDKSAGGYVDTGAQ